MGVYNAERWLADAFDSVLAQGVDDLEIVVMDDGSTDGTADVCDAYAARVRAFRQRNGGAAAARNGALAEIRGAYVGFLDGDDLWPPGRLALQLAAFVEDPALDVVYGHAANFRDADGQRHFEPALPSRLATAGLFTRSAVERIGPYDDSTRFGDLADWGERAGRILAHERMLPETVSFRRVHDSNAGLVHRDRQNAAYLAIVRRRLASRERR